MGGSTNLTEILPVGILSAEEWKDVGGRRKDVSSLAPVCCSKVSIDGYRFVLCRCNLCIGSLHYPTGKRCNHRVLRRVGWCVVVGRDRQRIMAAVIVMVNETRSYIMGGMIRSA